MYAYVLEISGGFFEGVCAPSNATAHSCDPPPPHLDSPPTLFQRCSKSNMGVYIRAFYFLEAAPIGWQLFVLESGKSDSIVFLLLLATYATRLLAQALRRAPSSSYPNVYVMNSDGSGQIKLTGTKVGDTDEAWGAWSPDGKKIAFTIRPSFSNNIDIYVINPDGTCPANLTGTKKRAETAPSWAPDGEKIAYLRGSSAAGLFTDLYVMQADGANQTRLIEAGDTAEFEVSFRLLAWSPDGKKIAFLRTTTENPASSAPGSAAPASGPSGIYVIKPNSSGLRKLSKGLSYTGLLVWSPDGKKIAFAGSQGAYDGGKIAYVVNADGTERRKLLSSEDSISSLAWSPDGKKIAFSNTIDIYVINPDGSGQTNLTSTNGIPETAPSWSPNGKQIAFTSGELYDNQDIYVMNTEGTGRTRLAENASSPSFAPRAGEK